MIYLKRLGIILLSTAALLAMRAASNSWLAPLIESRFGMDSGKLAEVIFFGLIVLVIAAVPTLRREMKIRVRGSWILAIAAAFPAINVFWLKSLPTDLTLLSAMSLALGGIAVGINEEIFMRGFGFARNGEATPRFSVIMTSVVFGLIHFFNLTAGAAFAEVCGMVVLATFIGLVFGLIRMVNGSIFWCAAIHAAINATVEFTDTAAPGYSTAALIVSLIALLLTVVMLVVHPAMRGQERTPSQPDNPGLPVRLQE